MDIKMPENVSMAVSKLAKAGFEAYIVGGCVRDSLLGRPPLDWDICTSALPEQVLECFKGYQILETGLKHGTLTLILDKRPYEITTFRLDSQYSDNRHPDQVEFISNLQEDLARRDFTINAMAYNPAQGLIDYHGGLKDLNQRVIACVGQADHRFREDALRILRALRLAAELEFKLEEKTQAALFENKQLLAKISPERINSEFSRLLLSREPQAILAEYNELIYQFIPELKPLLNFRQNNPYHYLDVWQHTLEALKHTPPNLLVRLTILFHDIAKPTCYTQDQQGIGHFYKHARLGSQMALEILKRLKYDRPTVTGVSQLILEHDAEILPQAANLKRWLNKLGREKLNLLLQVKTADAKAHVPQNSLVKLAVLEEAALIIQEIIQDRQCFQLADLAVNGKDLLSIGIPEGPGMGELLKRLLEKVMEEELPNERAALLAFIKNPG